MRRSAGPCRSVIVPTMISRSAWRGEKRGNSAPKRAMSYLGAATDMNSMPQHAVTNGYWNSENFRAQLAAASTLVVAKSRKPMSYLLPPHGALAPHICKRDHEDSHEHEDLAQAEERQARATSAGLQRARAGELAVADGPRVKECRFDVEHQEHDRDLVELHFEAGARAPDDVRAAFVRHVLGLVEAAWTDVLGQRRQRQRETDTDEDHQCGGEVV